MSETRTIADPVARRRREALVQWARGGRQGPRPDEPRPTRGVPPCIHRGASRGFVDCVPCETNGTPTRVESFACDSPKVEAATCTLAREARGAAICAGCSRRLSPGAAAVMADLTVLVTYWERQPQLDRLLASLDREYPGLPVLVQDTGGNLSWGRNDLARRCTTTYAVIAEEDFEFTSRTRLEKAAEILDENPGLGIVGGKLDERRNGKYQDIFWDRDFVRAGKDFYLGPPKSPWSRTSGGVRYRACDIVLNWGLARVQCLRDVPGDERIPIHEHGEHFYRIWRDGRWGVAYTPELIAKHHRDGYTPTYAQGRARRSTDYVQRKHGFAIHWTEPPKAKPAGPLNLPAAYKRNRSPRREVDQRSRGLGWQEPVYRRAAELAKERGCRYLVDVGCGIDPREGYGFDWVVGVDLPYVAPLRKSGAFVAAELDRQAPPLVVDRNAAVVCADVVEHLRDPLPLLRWLAECGAGVVIVSTPDRGRMPTGAQAGPPRNPSHAQEWTAEEFDGLLASVGFKRAEAFHGSPKAGEPEWCYAVARA